MTKSEKLLKKTKKKIWGIFFGKFHIALGKSFLGLHDPNEC